MSDKLPYYVVKRGDGRFELRQERYRVEFMNGREHPHCLMATCFRAQEMSELIDKYFRGMCDKHDLTFPE